MTLILIAGAVAGLGLLLLGLVLAPARPNPAVALVQLDAERGRRSADRAAAARLAPGQVLAPRAMRELGGSVSAMLGRAGFQLGSLRADLLMLGRSVETHLAVTVLAAVGGFLTPIMLAVLAAVVTGLSVGGVSGLLGLVVGLVAGAMPTLVLRPRAQAQRAAFRNVVGSFLDLVAMNLAGGRGVPEALQNAATVSDGWAMVRIRDTLLAARLRGVTPWAALGELGQQVRVDELTDLAAALALVAEDGAKVRESLTARATSMRKRELAEAEGKAGEKSQSMLVAQLLLCVGFLIFLVYPAASQMLGQ